MERDACVLWLTVASRSFANLGGTVTGRAGSLYVFLVKHAGVIARAVRKILTVFRFMLPLMAEYMGYNPLGWGRHARDFRGTVAGIVEC